MPPMLAWVGVASATGEKNIAVKPAPRQDIN
jgi:hypothetical protein